MRHVTLPAVLAAIGVVALGLGSNATQAAAGVIRGVVVTSPQRSRPASGSPGGIAAKPAAQKGARDAVVYLEQVPEKVEKKLAKTARKKAPRPQRIVQSKLRFVPRVLATPAGSMVEIENLDRVYHNTFSISTAKRFDLGKYAPGAIDTIVFDRVGVANLHCDIHPDESAFVVVVPNHAYARPDSLGRFELPKLPRGLYTIRVWHPRLGEITREVEMPKHGDVALELKF